MLLACMAVPVGASFESEYKNYSGEWAGGSIIKMKLAQDTLTFDYSPVFFFDSRFNLSEQNKARIVDDCVAGFKQWAGVYEIGGRALTVEVDVHPSTTGSKNAASVKILPNSLFANGGIVPGCLIWRRESSRLAITLRTQTPQNRNFKHLAMHEFGHVLGLFDAYGYGSIAGLGWLLGWLLPEAPLDRAPAHTIMRGSGGDITPTEVEMLLYAWKNNRLQLYTKSALTWLGAQVSPAFSN